MLKKKSLGQNFLKSQSALLAMVSASNPTLDDVVLEIGPGEGALTKELVMRAGKVIALEKDHRLIPVLQEKFASEIASGKLELIEGDILEFDVSSLPEKYKLIANIPYYITGQIFRMFLETEHQPESITVLVQKEVAERIIARDGKESLLSLSVKVFGTPKLVRTVGKGAFLPQPTVDSAILHVNNISKNKLNGLDEKFFFTIMHSGFAHKRKQLLSNLKELAISASDLEKAFLKCGLDTKSRAEDIPVETWVILCKKLK